MKKWASETERERGRLKKRLEAEKCKEVKEEVKENEGKKKSVFFDL